MYKLIEVKQTIKNLFPQLKNWDFKIWHDSSDDENTFCLQCHADNKFYGHEYKVNLIEKTLTNR